MTIFCANSLLSDVPLPVNCYDIKQKEKIQKFTRENHIETVESNSKDADILPTDTPEIKHIDKIDIFTDFTMLIYSNCYLSSLYWQDYSCPKK